MVVSADAKRTPNPTLAKQLIDCAMLVKEGDMNELIPEVMKELDKYVKEKPKPISKHGERKDKEAPSNDGGRVRKKKKSKPSFHRNMKNSHTNLMVFGWVQQQRRSKMRTVWKEVLVSVVGGTRPGQQTTLWIQRSVKNEKGKTELEQLHQLPLSQIDEVAFLSKGNRFSIKEYDDGEVELVFRCPDDPNAAQNWVIELQKLRVSDNNAARGLPTIDPTNRRPLHEDRPARRVPDDAKAAPPPASDAKAAPPSKPTPRSEPQPEKDPENEPIHSATLEKDRHEPKLARGLPKESNHSVSSSNISPPADGYDKSDDAFFEMVTSTPKRLSMSEDYPPDERENSPGGENIDTLMSAMLPLQDNEKYQALKQAQKEFDDRKEQFVSESYNIAVPMEDEKRKDVDDAKEYIALAAGDTIPNESTATNDHSDVAGSKLASTTSASNSADSSEGSYSDSRSSEDGSLSEDQASLYDDGDGSLDPRRATLEQDPGSERLGEQEPRARDLSSEAAQQQTDDGPAEEDSRNDTLLMGALIAPPKKSKDEPEAPKERAIDDEEPIEARDEVDNGEEEKGSEPEHPKEEEEETSNDTKVVGAVIAPQSEPSKDKPDEKSVDEPKEASANDAAENDCEPELSTDESKAVGTPQNEPEDAIVEPSEQSSDSNEAEEEPPEEPKDETDDFEEPESRAQGTPNDTVVVGALAAPLAGSSHEEPRDELVEGAERQDETDVTENGEALGPAEDSTPEDTKVTAAAMTPQNEPEKEIEESKEQTVDDDEPRDQEEEKDSEQADTLKDTKVVGAEVAAPQSESKVEPKEQSVDEPKDEINDKEGEKSGEPEHSAEESTPQGTKVVGAMVSTQSESKDEPEEAMDEVDDNQEGKDDEPEHQINEGESQDTLVAGVVAAPQNESLNNSGEPKDEADDNQEGKDDEPEHPTDEGEPQDTLVAGVVADPQNESEDNSGEPKDEVDTNDEIKDGEPEESAPQGTRAVGALISTQSESKESKDEEDSNEEGKDDEPENPTDEGETQNTLVTGVVAAPQNESEDNSSKPKDRVGENDEEKDGEPEESVPQGTRVVGALISTRSESKDSEDEVDSNEEGKDDEPENPTDEGETQDALATGVVTAPQNESEDNSSKPKDGVGENDEEKDGEPEEGTPQGTGAVGALISTRSESKDSKDEVDSNEEGKDDEPENSLDEGETQDTLVTGVVSAPQTAAEDGSAEPDEALVEAEPEELETDDLVEEKGGKPREQSPADEKDDGPEEAGEVQVQEPQNNAEVKDDSQPTSAEPSDATKDSLEESDVGTAANASSPPGPLEDSNNKEETQKVSDEALEPGSAEEGEDIAAAAGTARLGQQEVNLNNQEEEATSESQKIDLTAALKQEWAVSPVKRSSGALRPFVELMTTVHTVLPPNFDIPEHSHFKRWTPVTRQDLGMTNDPNSRPDDKVLKKRYKKLRKLFHPEGLPKDFNDQQREFCECLWNILNKAWDNQEGSESIRQWMNAPQF